MSLTRTECHEKAAQRLRDSTATRAAYEAICGMSMVYAYGDQWSRLSHGTRGGQSLKQLRPVIDPDRRDVRVAINEIRPRIEQANSWMEPQKLEFDVRSASPATNDRIAAQVGQKRLEVFCRSAKALKKQQARVRWVTVLGSAVVRRTMASRGKTVVLRGPDGEPSQRKNGSLRTIRTFQHDWQVCPAYEFVRDPAANSIDFEGEDCIGHEKPVMADYIVRQFGPSALPKPVTATIGQYMSMQSFIYRATGQSLGARPSDSKAKGVLLSEWWFRDPDSEADNDWPWWMLAYRDAYGEKPGDRELKVLEFGPNPYQDLPLHHYVYDAPPGHAWGGGIPQQVIAQQDLTNLAWTGILRVLLLHSNGPAFIRDGSIKGSIQELMAKRYTKPVIVKSQAKDFPPMKYLDHRPLDPVAATIIQKSHGLMDDALNQSPIQRGITSPRGESGQAVGLKKEAADQPITTRARRDALTTNELLTGSLFDIAKADTLKGLKQILSGEFSDVEIATFRNQDLAKAGIGVYVTEGSKQPRTPRESREDAVLMVKSGILDATRARLGILLRSGEAIDPLEGKAFEYQQQENRLLLEGMECPVEECHLHPIHILALTALQNDPSWMLYSEDQKNRINEHLGEHKEYMEASQMMAQGQPGQPNEPIAGELEGPPVDFSQQPPAQGLGQTLPFPQQAQGPAMMPAPAPMGAPGAGPVEAMAVG